MQVGTPQARNRAGLNLNLVIGVIGSSQAISRLKAKLELAVEDAMQGLSQEASLELGIEIGRWNIETSISQPEGDGSASNGQPSGHSVKQLEAALNPPSQALLKAGCS